MASEEQIEQRAARRKYVEETHTSIAIAGVVSAVVGWSGIFWVATNTLPTVPNRWAFFALFQIAVMGTALPLIRYLYRRFSRDSALHVEPGTLVRQALWVGLFGSLCLWLRIPRLLSLPLALVILSALIVIEALIRLRERMRWSPR